MKAPRGCMDKRTIIKAEVGTVIWDSPSTGFCKCPGEHYHQSRNGKRDCRVYLEPIPTVYCLHASCGPIIKDINRKIRSSIGHAFPSRKADQKITIEEFVFYRQMARKQSLQLKARNSLNQILNNYKWASGALRAESPITLSDDPEEHWQLCLKLFKPYHFVWIGREWHSGPKYERCFRHVEEWELLEWAPAPFICPSVFKSGSVSRKNENVAARLFLVVESDTLRKDDVCAIFLWCRQFMRLRMIVDTGGKSLHGWFDFPDPMVFQQLSIILPELQCDRKMLTASQPCRLPGAIRKARYQSILWMDKL
jgi:hypothetical protein